jgi:hypothetical protein
MNTEIPKQKGKTPNEKNADEKGGLEEYLIANENGIGAKIWLQVDGREIIERRTMIFV